MPAAEARGAGGAQPEPRQDLLHPRTAGHGGRLQTAAVVRAAGDLARGHLHGVESAHRLRVHGAVPLLHALGHFRAAARARRLHPLPLRLPAAGAAPAALALAAHRAVRERRAVHGAQDVPAATGGDGDLVPSGADGDRGGAGLHAHAASADLVLRARTPGGGDASQRVRLVLRVVVRAGEYATAHPRGGAECTQRGPAGAGTAASALPASRDPPHQPSPQLALLGQHHTVRFAGQPRLQPHRHRHASVPTTSAQPHAVARLQESPRRRGLLLRPRAPALSLRRRAAARRRETDRQLPIAPRRRGRGRHTRVRHCRTIRCALLLLRGVCGGSDGAERQARHCVLHHAVASASLPPLTRRTGDGARAAFRPAAACECEAVRGGSVDPLQLDGARHLHATRNTRQRAVLLLHSLGRRRGHFVRGQERAAHATADESHRGGVRRGGQPEQHPAGADAAAA